MKLSLTSWSFPSCTLPECAAIARALGIGALDIGPLHRPALDRAEILADPAAAAERLQGLGVKLANLYHLFGRDLADRNLALPGSTDANARDLERVFTFADAAGIASVFVLPGIVNPGQSRAEAGRVATQSLTELGRVAGHHRARLCVEPHVHSWAESPDLARRLAEESGVGLVLDHAHFACLGYRQDEVDPMAALAVHVHLRQARMGALQAKFAQGTLNFPAIFASLRDAGYQGWLALEAVHQDYMATLTEDVLTETVALRDCFHRWKGTA